MYKLGMEFLLWLLAIKDEIYQIVDPYTLRQYIFHVCIISSLKIVSLLHK